MADERNIPPGSAGDPDTGDSREAFESGSQDAAFRGSDMKDNWASNRKRTFDAYQQRDFVGIDRSQTLFEDGVVQARKELAAINAVTTQHLQNAVALASKVNTDAADNVTSTRAQVLKHSDVAMDGLWTDQLNPVVRASGDALAGQAPVNAMGASTATLDVMFTNISAQNGQLITGYVTLAQALSTSNAAITANLAGLTAALAQIVENMKQAGTKTA